MADGVQFNIEGMEELQGKLQELSLDLRNRGGRAALRKSAKVIETAAKSEAMKIDDSGTSENIAKNITIRWGARQFKRTGDLSFRVGVLGGGKQYVDNTRNRRLRRVGKDNLTGGSKGNPGGDTWYWRLIHFGFMNWKSGRMVPARPFMLRALEKNVQSTTNTFITEYGKAIDRALKRAKKASKK